MFTVKELAERVEKSLQGNGNEPLSQGSGLVISVRSYHPVLKL
jgi:hypothetical protein